MTEKAGFYYAPEMSVPLVSVKFFKINGAKAQIELEMLLSSNKSSLGLQIMLYSLETGMFCALHDLKHLSRPSQSPTSKS